MRRQLLLPPGGDVLPLAGTGRHWTSIAFWLFLSRGKRCSAMLVPQICRLFRFGTAQIAGLCRLHFPTKKPKPSSPTPRHEFAEERYSPSPSAPASAEPLEKLEPKSEPFPRVADAIPC
jgi:hypothetical protein